MLALEEADAGVQETVVVAFDKDGMLDVLQLESEQVGKGGIVRFDINVGEVIVGKGKPAFQGFPASTVAVEVSIPEIVINFGKPSAKGG